MRTSVYNVETRIGKNGKAYIMEVSPRGGGNRLSEMLRHATGVDLITNAVRAAVGDEVIGVEQKAYDGHWAEIILHAPKEGIFQGLEISDDIRPLVVEEDLWVKRGERISGFRGANDAIGTLVLRFGSAEELENNLNGEHGLFKVLMA